MPQPELSRPAIRPMRNAWTLQQRGASGLLVAVGSLLVIASGAPADSDGTALPTMLMAQAGTRSPPTLPVGHFHEGTLACGDSQCVRHAFHLPVFQAGQLQMDIYVPNGPTEVGVLIRDGDHVVASSGTPGERPRRIRVPVTPGTLLVEFFVLGRLQTVRYDVNTRIESGGSAPAVAPPVPKPAPRPPARVAAPARRRAAPSASGLEVVEVEFERGDPAFVLIASDARHRVGQTGRLMDEDDRIGQIEIVELLEGGARAQVVGELRGVITARTRVQLNR